jgi:glycerophosphoryl diester phosphodiesterase
VTTPVVPLPPGFLTRPVAHRALHDVARLRPENSRAAVSAAVTEGYAIEIDVQLSSDGEAMVFHDETLDRLTADHGPVQARTANTLKQIALRHSDETIPSLAEILALVDSKVPLLIEVKDQTGRMGPTDGRLEAATAQALRDYAGPVAVMSFNPHAVAEMARVAPHIPRGLTTSAYEPDAWSPLDPAICDRLREIPDYERVGASFLSHEASDLARPRVLSLKAAGATILCWTIRSPAAEAIARRIAHNVTFEGYAAARPG